jgi:hypothetical protein
MYRKQAAGKNQIKRLGDGRKYKKALGSEGRMGQNKESTW